MLRLRRDLYGAFHWTVPSHSSTHHPLPSTADSLTCISGVYLWVTTLLQLSWTQSTHLISPNSHHQYSTFCHFLVGPLTNTSDVKSNLGVHLWANPWFQTVHKYLSQTMPLFFLLSIHKHCESVWPHTCRIGKGRLTPGTIPLVHGYAHHIPQNTLPTTWRQPYQPEQGPLHSNGCTSWNYC